MYKRVNPDASFEMESGSFRRPIATLADEYGGKLQIYLDNGCYVMALRISKETNKYRPITHIFAEAANVLRELPLPTAGTTEKEETVEVTEFSIEMVEQLREIENRLRMARRCVADEAERKLSLVIAGVAEVRAHYLDCMARDAAVYAEDERVTAGCKSCVDSDTMYATLQRMKALLEKNAPDKPNDPEGIDLPGIDVPEFVDGNNA